MYNESRLSVRSAKLLAILACWPEGHFCHDASRESKPVGATLGGHYTRNSTIAQLYKPNAHRLAIRETPRRLCVRTATSGNSLNNYPNSIRNHATCRAVAPSLDLTSPIRDIILFKLSLSIFRDVHTLPMLTALYSRIRLLHRHREFL